MSEEARSSVDNISSMGFPKDRVIRAVEKIGTDGKEVRCFNVTPGSCRLVFI